MNKPFNERIIFSFFQDEEEAMMPQEMSELQETYFAKSYEELLATAIINKVKKILFKS